MALKICRSVSHHRICGSVGFVKGIGAECRHIVKYLFGYTLGHSPCNRSLTQNITLFILFTVNKELPFPLHNSVLFLGHRSSYNIRSAEGITCKTSENLHYLLLINDTTVGYIKNRLKQFGFIAHILRIVAIMNILRNRIHRSRSVKGKNCRQVLYILRTKAAKNIFHSVRFELENTVGQSLSHHFIGCFIVKAHIFHRKIRILFSYKLLGISNNREVTESQKVHFKKS